MRRFVRIRMHQTTAPANLERVDGTDLSRVKLTPKAAERMGIKTIQLREGQVTGAAATPRRVVPYAAVLYDSNNKTWVYTNPQPLTYVRQRITIDHIDRDEAVLSDGPSAGTVVVTVGAAELFGIEFEKRN